MSIPVKDRDIHIRKYPDAATAKPVWCGQTGVASITEAWGYYGLGGNGHDEVCRGCLHAQREAHRSQKGTST
jgi:hypothetical protein